MDGWHSTPVAAIHDEVMQSELPITLDPERSDSQKLRPVTVTDEYDEIGVLYVSAKLMTGASNVK